MLACLLETSSIRSLLMDFFLYCCIYTADGCSTKSFTAVIQCQIVYKSVSATVHLIPLELHCATLHPMSTPGAWRPRGFNDGVKHGRLRRLCTNLHQTWCYYVTIAVLKPAAARHRRLDSVVRCAAQFKHRVVDRSWPPRCRIKPKPNMITFTRKKQAPQVMLDCKSHTQVTSGPPTYSTVLHTGVRATKVPFPAASTTACRRAGWPYQAQFNHRSGSQNANSFPCTTSKTKAHWTRSIAAPFQATSSWLKSTSDLKQDETGFTTRHNSCAPSSCHCSQQARDKGHHTPDSP